VVKKTKSPHNTGELCPRPGIFAFQTIFFVSDHQFHSARANAAMPQGPPPQIIQG
jgi:hypothetical protein